MLTYTARAFKLRLAISIYIVDVADPVNDDGCHFGILMRLDHYRLAAKTLEYHKRNRDWC